MSIVIAVATVSEIGFLRGTWMDGAQRLAWLEDYAGAAVQQADLPAPDAIADSIRLEHVTFRYPGADRLALDDVNRFLPAGSVVAVVGENGAGPRRRAPGRPAHTTRAVLARGRRRFLRPVAEAGPGPRVHARRAAARRAR